MSRIMITGSTDGIGLETARQLLALGHEVLVHGRHATRAKEACATLLRQFPRGIVWPVWGDLSRMSEVVELAGQVTLQTPTLDVLINNAGIYAPRRTITADGFELTLAVNHFAHFLLTCHLLPNLHRATAGRIITVSSGTHHSAKLMLKDLNGELSWSSYGAYSNSKLANILFTRSLSAKLANTPITANALHPGVIGTKLLRVGFGAGGAPTTQGARTSVYLATATEVAATRGKYFVDCRETPAAPIARDVRLSQDFWHESGRLLVTFLPNQSLI